MDSDEEFVVYGTPRDLEEEDVIVSKKARTVAEQVVKDKQGRRRFHGAFTGGFSAGFFNTVGSAEGWRPSTFKSSRSKKFESQSQKPEDFMDDEDTGDFGFAPKGMRVNDDYDDSSEHRDTNKRKYSARDGHLPGQHNVLGNILRPVRSTVGVRLLKKMGWRFGQGVGPRLSKKEKKEQRKELSRIVKTYGCALPDSDQIKGKPMSGSDGEDTSSDSDDGDVDSITFAPDDYDPYIINVKTDLFGIGYSGLDRRPVLSGHFNLFEPAPAAKDKNKKLLIQGKGFGVGALEEEDEDIYVMDDMSNYDFSLENKASSSKWQKEPSRASHALPSTELMEGFVTAKIILKRKFFPPPKLPSGYQPVHIVKKSRFEPKLCDSESDGKKQGLQRHALIASDRSVMIGEPVADPKPAEVADERNSALSPCIEISEESTVNTGGAFRPFVAYPDKQKRYEQYIVLIKNNQKEKLASLQPLSMTDWERERERLEFQQASKLYQPLSAAFSDRFISASQPDDSTDPLVEVQRTLDNQNDKKEAARKKMFGLMTRTVKVWAPASLLCKRFNIPDPHVREHDTGKSRRPKFSVFNFLEASTHNVHRTSTADDKAMSETGEPENKEEIETEMKIKDSNKEDSKEILENETTEGPSKLLDFEEPSSKEDLYKAIFLSSSDESETEESTPAGTSLNRATSLATPVTLVNALRNTSPPRGIFANLDLDALSSRKIDKKVDASSMKKTSDTEDKEMENQKHKTSVIDKTDGSLQGGQSVSFERANDDASMYGPLLPTLPLLVKETLTCKSDRTVSKTKHDEKWVELNTTKKSKKHKKEHKRSKSQHKHKKSKKHRH